MDEEAEGEDMEEEGEQLTPEQLLAKCNEELEEQKQIDIEKGVRFTDEQFAVLKYETNDVKTLKNLTVSNTTHIPFYIYQFYLSNNTHTHYIRNIF